MNVAQFLRSLSTRPLACAIIAILAITAGTVGWLTSPPIYQSTAVVVVIPPGSGNPDAMMNPLVNLDNNLAQLAAVVATALRIEGGRLATAAGGSGEFTVDTTYGDSPQFAQLSSQLVIQSQGPDAESAQHSTQALVDFAGTTLDKIQADSWVPTRNNATTVSSVAAQPGTEVPTSAVRRGASYAAAIALTGVVLLVLYDGLRERVRRNRVRARSEGRHHGSATAGPDIAPANDSPVSDNQTGGPSTGTGAAPIATRPASLS